MGAFTKNLKFFLKLPILLLGTIDEKLAFMVVVFFLSKVLISKINDADQTLIGLNSALRLKGLSKTKGFVKSALLIVKSKC